MKTVDILGLSYAITDYQRATSFIIRQAKLHVSTAIFALPVHGVVEAQTNQQFKRAVSGSDLIVPDGQPIRWLMNAFHKAGLKDRVYGPELTRHVLAAANQEKLKVFLYGGKTQATLDLFKTWIATHYVDVDVCGTYREKNFGEFTLSAKQVNQSGANIVLCGLGCPSQEIWIANNKPEISAAMLGVGAAFSLFAGTEKMAPSWMQNNGLEWLYRFLLQPRRLWKRYLVTNSLFIFYVMKEASRRLLLTIFTG